VPRENHQRFVAKPASNGGRRQQLDGNCQQKGRREAGLVSILIPDCETRLERRSVVDQYLLMTGPPQR
jgi:hypothetical protein